ncbi:alpha/beta hydrolase [Streptomyces albofaciens JCM 4342]|uniref:alpha/beta hydrolase n=1 Tax=Streptomyces albofaciens TaxID=66866 RepID=UPI00123A889B|nr:alpha/beta hydrolase [Streptomyces albofaciens]KAA6223651.1 alpha/beta hydrolase [Streptomyces albofaciens JCM 4342]
MPTAAPPSFLLVHGAWHRPACWGPLQDALAADGLRSHTVALPSSGPQGTPAAGVYDDAEAISARLREIDGPVVAVGHSYGGIPVTEAAAAHPHVVHLVYLAAYMPAEGESLGSLHGRESSGPVDPDGVRPPIFEDPRTSLYSDVPDEVAEWATGELVVQSRRSFQEPVTRAAWRTVPATYVVCEGDRALRPAMQTKMSANAAHVERLGTGHSPFLAAPAELAALLGRIASGATES